MAQILRCVRLELGVHPRDDGFQRHDTRPARADDARWHGPGERVSVKGFTLPGMVYVGNSLEADPSGRTPGVPEPSLIRPSLPIAPTDRGRALPSLDYWPSYSDIKPEARTAYLGWLADGLPLVASQIGYVFLYFYGIERRLLVDRPPAAERDLLVAEVERLRRVHAEDVSFMSYSRGLLDMVEAMSRLSDPEAMARWRPEPSDEPWPMNLSLKLALAARVVRGEPLDADLAIAGLLARADAGLRGMRIGASRTRAEFIALMRARFPAAFPRGFRIADRKDAFDLGLGYSPSSRHLRLRLEVAPGVGRLPDPTTLTWNKMDSLADKAMADLAAYARAVGPDGKGAGTVGALRHLPPELAGLDPGGSRAALSAWLEGQRLFRPVPFGELAGRCLGTPGIPFSSKQISVVAESLAPMGWGLEPDPAFSRIPSKLNEVVYLFRREAGPVSREPSPALERGMLAALLTAAADGVADKVSGDRRGEEDIPVVDWWIASAAPALGLTEGEQLRLRAHQSWLIGERSPGLAEAKRRSAALPQAERAELAALLTVAYGAAVDGIGTCLPALEAMHDALGVPRASLYASVHEVSAEAAARARRGPTAGAPAAAPTKAPAGKSPATPGALDLDRIRRIREETQQVSSALSEIYREDEDAAPARAPAAPAAATGTGPAPDPRFEGLAPELVPLAVLLATRGEWPRGEYEAAAAAMGLMPDGALENINQWAFDVLDDALAEDGDPITINTALLPPAR